MKRSEGRRREPGGARGPSSSYTRAPPSRTCQGTAIPARQVPSQSVEVPRHWLGGCRALEHCRQECGGRSHLGRLFVAHRSHDRRCRRETQCISAGHLRKTRTKKQTRQREARRLQTGTATRLATGTGRRQKEQRGLTSIMSSMHGHRALEGCSAPHPACVSPAHRRVPRAWLRPTCQSVRARAQAGDCLERFRVWRKSDRGSRAASSRQTLPPTAPSALSTPSPSSLRHPRSHSRPPRPPRGFGSRRPGTRCLSAP